MVESLSTRATVSLSSTCLLGSGWLVSSHAFRALWNVANLGKGGEGEREGGREGGRSEYGVFSKFATDCCMERVSVEGSGRTSWMGPCDVQ